MPKVAVIIVSYNHARFLKDCFGSLAKVTYPRGAWKIFLVDNASGDETVSLARSELIDEARGVTRQGNITAELIASGVNTGYTGGNNLAMRRAISEGYEYAYLLNPDTEVTPDFLDRTVHLAASDARIAGVQSLLLLAQDRARINSWGNEIHFLGFSFCGGYREERNGMPAREHLRAHDISVASGASVLYRLSALKELDFFDEAIFAYHEDVDLAWRLRLMGYRIVLAPESVVYHRYEFSRSIRKFYFMERNRLWVHVKNLKIPTLLLILPAWVVMELGLWFYAIKSGWWREKARAYRDFFAPKNLVRLWGERRKVQATRKVSDREIVKTFASRIMYQEIANPLWEYIGNPLFAAYWWLIRRIIP